MTDNLTNDDWNSSLFVLCVFALLRPIFTLSFAHKYSLLGMNLLEMFGIGSSYLFLLLCSTRLRSIPLNLTTGLFICFASYVLLSFMWGVDYKAGIKIILPYALLLSASSMLKNKNDVNKIAKYSIIGFIFPIIGSTIFIILGKSTSVMTIYQTGLQRYSGLYSVIHALAHSMFIYVVFYVLYLDTSIKEKANDIMMKRIGLLLCLLAIVNVYKSATRTVMLGLLVFVVSYLIGLKKYFMIFVVLAVLGAGFLMSSQGKQLLFDIIEPLQGDAKIEKLGSGRAGLWKAELDSFFAEPLEKQFIGKGLGLSSSRIYGKTVFGSSHNDFIALLISLGYFGLLLYVAILLSLLLSVFMSNISRPSKGIFIGLFMSIIFMNFSSNSYLSRFELAQYLALFIAIFLTYKNSNDNIEPAMLWRSSA